MEIHECKYEREWGKQMETTETIEKAVEEIKKCTQAIKQAVGDISTQVALNKQSIGRLWWFVGVTMVVFFGTGIKVWFFN